MQRIPGHHRTYPDDIPCPFAKDSNRKPPLLKVLDDEEELQFMRERWHESNADYGKILRALYAMPMGNGTVVSEDDFIRQNPTLPEAPCRRLFQLHTWYLIGCGLAEEDA